MNGFLGLKFAGGGQYHLVLYGVIVGVVAVGLMGVLVWGRWKKRRGGGGGREGREKGEEGYEGFKHRGSGMGSQGVELNDFLGDDGDEGGMGKVQRPRSLV